MVRGSFGVFLGMNGQGSRFWVASGVFGSSGYERSRFRVVLGNFG